MQEVGERTDDEGGRKWELGSGQMTNDEGGRRWEVGSREIKDGVRMTNNQFPMTNVKSPNHDPPSIGHFSLDIGNSLPPLVVRPQSMHRIKPCQLGPPVTVYTEEK